MAAQNRTTPGVFVVLAILGIAFVTLPLAGLIQRTPWSRAADVLTSDSSLTALRLSIVVASSAPGHHTLPHGTTPPLPKSVRPRAFGRL